MKTLLIPLCLVGILLASRPSASSATGVGISPGLYRMTLMQNPDGSDPITGSVNYGLYFSDSGTTTLSIPDGSSLGVEACLGSPHSGITTFDIQWTDGIPAFPLSPVAYVHVPANWAESQDPGIEELEVSHSWQGGGIGIGVVSQIWLQIIEPLRGPMLDLVADKATLMLGEQVRIEAYGVDTRNPIGYNYEYLWTPEATIELCYETETVTGWYESHLGTSVYGLGGGGSAIPPSQWIQGRSHFDSCEVVDYRWDFESDDIWDTDWTRAYLADIRLVAFSQPGIYTVTVQARTYDAGSSSDIFTERQIDFTVVPEPTTLALLLLGGLALLKHRR